jgi:hypothetical protein
MKNPVFKSIVLSLGGIGTFVDQVFGSRSEVQATETPAHIQQQIMAKAEAKRERKNRKRRRDYINMKFFQPIHMPYPRHQYEHERTPR